MEALREVVTHPQLQGQTFCSTFRNTGPEKDLETGARSHRFLLSLLLLNCFFSAEEKSGIHPLFLRVRAGVRLLSQEEKFRRKMCSNRLRHSATVRP